MITPSIGLIAPTPKIGELAQNIASQLGILENLSLHIANMEEGLSIARQLEAAGADVLIARSGTAELIAKNLPTPIVHIPITPQDMAKAIGKAKQFTKIDRPRVALLAIEAYHSDLMVIADLIGIDLALYRIDGTIKQLSQQINQAIADGANVIVAGSVGEKMGNEQNFPTLMLDSGPIALRIALEEANKIAYARKLEKAVSKRFRTVVEASKDGIFVLNKEGLIQISNSAAARILNLKENLVGRHLKDLLSLPQLTSCLKKGETVLDVLVNTPDNSIIVNIMPTIIDEDIHGAIITFQNAQSITELETKIRKKLYSKGFVSQYTFEDIMGSSPQILEAVRIARNFAGSPSTVLLIGETGTGKELFAHSIHSASWCRDGPFVAVNCSALPPSLLESELFGYEEGAFTGAQKKGKLGLFELAHRGTLFLDEISEMNNYAQLRLLRVLQERRTMRLGGDRFIPIEVRIIAASNRNLWEMVNKGKFRQDLFYRLSVLALTIPPLRQRTGDLVLLAQHFGKKCHFRYGHTPQLTQAIIERFEQHDWPGNIRELENVIERLTLTQNGISTKLINSNDLFGQSQPSYLGAFLPFHSVDMDERREIIQALEHTYGHQGKAAKLLQMDRTTLYRKMRKYKINKRVI